MENTVLSPGQLIRPPTTEETAKVLVQKLYGLKPIRIVGLNSYDDKNYHVLCAENHGNPYVNTPEMDGYVLKIINSLDSRRTNIIEAQNEMMIFLNERGINCPTPIKNLMGTYYSLENLDKEDSTKKYAVRLLIYRTGKILHKAQTTGDLLQKVGSFAARLDNILTDFTHSGYYNRKTLWMLDSIPSLRQFTFVVKNITERQMIEDIIVTFEREVLPIIPQLEKGVIHGDLNDQNIIVNENGTDVAAIIDFGDAHRTCLIFELAIALCYMVLEAGDVAMGKYVIEGYTSVRKLSYLEKSILKVCVCARMSQSLVMGTYSHSQDPENDYLLITQKTGWVVLRKLWPMSEEEVMKAWGLLDS